MGTRTLPLALWLLVVGGVVLGGLALVRGPGAASVGDVPAPVVRWDVAGFAESFVAAFVAAGEGTEATLVPFLGDHPDALTGMVAGVWFASRTTTSGVEPVGVGRWRVRVAAELLHRTGPEAPYAEVGMRDLVVDVVDRGGGLVATGWPAMVAGLSAATAVDDGWPAGSPPPAGDVIADTVQRFVAALLTGNGELARYAAPGSGLRAAPATFETVTVDRWAIRGAGERRRVRAWVVGVAGGSRMWLVYDLTVARREGRWEIEAVGSPAGGSPAKPAATAVPSSTSSGGS